MNKLAEHHIAFGPVPSRRLGQSLGINNVTSKTCSYSCIYCQVGPTGGKTIEPRHFFSPAQIHDAVANQLEKVKAKGLKVDFLTFVPEGEPTLDVQLGESINALRGFGIPIAVITNGSLLSQEAVSSSLYDADLVSVKVDSVKESIWRKINLPPRDLRHDVLLQGVRRFAVDYEGSLFTDTMLIAGLNDDVESLTATAEFLAEIRPQAAYLATPTRPTTVKNVIGSDEAGLIRAHAIYSAKLPEVRWLTDPESGEFAHTGDAINDLLAITAVHPMRKADVQRLLSGDGADWGLIDTLLSEGKITCIEYQGEHYYMRPLRCGRHQL